MITKKNRGVIYLPPGKNQNRNQFVGHGGGPLNQKKKDSRVYRKTCSLPLIFRENQSRHYINDEVWETVKKVWNSWYEKGMKFLTLLWLFYTLKFQLEATVYALVFTINQQIHIVTFCVHSHIHHTSRIPYRLSRPPPCPTNWSTVSTTNGWVGKTDRIPFTLKFHSLNHAVKPII